MSGPIDQIREVKVGHVVSSNDVWIYSADELVPAAEQLGFRFARHHLGASDGGTGAKSEDIAHKGSGLAVPANIFQKSYFKQDAR